LKQIFSSFKNIATIFDDFACVRDMKLRLLALDVASRARM